MYVNGNLLHNHEKRIANKMSVAAPGEPAQIEAMSIEHGVHGQCLLFKCFVPHSNGLNSNLLVHINTIGIVIIKNLNLVVDTIANLSFANGASH